MSVRARVAVQLLWAGLCWCAIAYVSTLVVSSWT